MNKLIIGDTEYELQEYWTGSGDNPPSIILNGRHYLGVAVVKDKWFFTTYDKVSIHSKTDKIWVVNSSWNKFETSSGQAMEWLEEERDDFTFFAYENNASEFLLMNKPCLSVNDITDIILLTGGTIEKLKQLAKEKINATA